MVRIGAVHLERQRSLGVDELGHAAKRHEREVAGHTGFERITQHVVGGGIHLAETVVRQTF